MLALVSLLLVQKQQKLLLQLQALHLQQQDRGRAVAGATRVTPGLQAAGSQQQAVAKTVPAAAAAANACWQISKQQRQQQSLASLLVTVTAICIVTSWAVTAAPAAWTLMSTCPTT
jgi:hypothetical protein